MKTNSQDAQRLRQRLVGRFLKEAREQAGLTQQEVAKRLAYTSAQFVSNWERGMSLPPFDVLPRLATLLKASPKEMLDVLYEYLDEHLKLRREQLLAVFRKRFPGVR